jgi:hypothetical protein
MAWPELCTVRLETENLTFGNWNDTAVAAAVAAAATAVARRVCDHCRWMC